MSNLAIVQQDKRELIIDGYAQFDTQLPVFTATGWEDHVQAWIDADDLARSIATALGGHAVGGLVTCVIPLGVGLGCLRGVDRGAGLLERECAAGHDAASLTFKPRARPVGRSSASSLIASSGSSVPASFDSSRFTGFHETSRLRHASIAAWLIFPSATRPARNSASSPAS